MTSDARQEAAGNQDTLSVWRARFAFQCFSTLSMLVLFALVVAGIGKEARNQLGAFFVLETSSGASQGESDFFNGIYLSFNEFVYKNPTTIDLIHQVGGYALIFLLPMSGVALMMLAKRLSSDKLLRVLGLSIIATSLVALVMSVASGKFATPPNETFNNDGSDRVATLMRSAEATKAHEAHLYRAAPLTILPVLLVCFAASMISTRRVKEAAGIVKNRKKA
ncbi:MAG: hypothetical protein KDB07_05750 [Planctomycetes bacterium]|nr:hypothetical protein [Planctomycetota bacterium]